MTQLLLPLGLGLVTIEWKFEEVGKRLDRTKAWICGNAVADVADLLNGEARRFVSVGQVGFVKRLPDTVHDVPLGHAREAREKILQTKRLDAKTNW